MRCGISRSYCEADEITKYEVDVLSQCIKFVIAYSQGPAGADRFIEPASLSEPAGAGKGRPRSDVYALFVEVPSMDLVSCRYFIL